MYQRLLCVCFIMMLLLTGCAGDDKIGLDEQATGEEMTEMPLPVAGNPTATGWTLYDTVIPDGDKALGDLIPANGTVNEVVFNIAGDTVYRVVHLLDDEGSVLGNCVQKLEPPYDAWVNFTIMREEWKEGERCCPNAVALCPDGSVQMIVQGMVDEEQSRYYRGTWAEEDGYSLQEIDAARFTMDFWMNLWFFHVDSAGNVYFRVGEELKCFDKEVSGDGLWKFGSDIFQVAENPYEEGKKYLCERVDGKFQMREADTRKLVFATQETLVYGGASVVFAGERTGYLSGEDGIWYFDIGEGTFDNLISFYGSGYPVERFWDAGLSKEGNLLLLAEMDGERVLLEKKQDSEHKDKVELELATMYANSFLKEAVVDFNRHNKEYHIVLRTPENGESYDDFRTRIRAELSNQEGPDILMDDVMDLKLLAEKEYLLDLTEVFATTREGMIENVRPLGKVGEGYYGVPYSFCVATIAAPEDALADVDKWTVENMMKCVEANAAESAISYYTAGDLFGILTIGCNTAEDGYGLENAEEILAFSKQYADSGRWEDVGLRLSQGRTLMRSASIGSLVEAQTTEAVFKGKEIYIGYPGKEDAKGSLLSGSTLSINSFCEHSEGAVAFINSLLSAEKQEKIGRHACTKPDANGFPVNAQALEEMFGYAEEEQKNTNTVSTDIGGFEYDQKPLEPENLEKVRVLLYSAQVEEEAPQVLWDIIGEETPAYFAGDKFAGEVCDIMRNRMQIYLNEQ